MVETLPRHDIHESEQQASDLERRKLKLIVNDDLLEMFVSYMATEYYGEDNGVLVEETLIREYSKFGAFHSLHLRNSLSSPFWPEDTPQMSEYVEHIDGWIESDYVKGFMIEDMTVADYLEQNHG